MLIISKQKDYYDGVVGTTGVDKTIVYNREEKTLDYKDIPEVFQSNNLYHWKKYKVRRFNTIANHSLKSVDKYLQYSHFIVGFCGRLYIGWKLYYEVKKGVATELCYDITYDFDLVKSIVKEHSYYGNILDQYNYIKNYPAMNLFRELKTPVFVYDHDYERLSLRHYYSSGREKFIINPILKKYEFFKVFDAFQTLQEIQMFIGETLTDVQPIVEISDKCKIEQYGFDYKLSFRKDKK